MIDHYDRGVVARVSDGPTNGLIDSFHAQVLVVLGTTDQFDNVFCVEFLGLLIDVIHLLFKHGVLGVGVRQANHDHASSEAV